MKKCRSLFISSSECLIMAMYHINRISKCYKKYFNWILNKTTMENKKNPNEEDPLKYFMLNSRLQVNHVVVNVTRVCSEDH
ncbi:hypothetical protein T06_6380 [Trichinella sp. T6]|nr:hypothetical protein T06_6380 [Trichinella sp. T6]